MVDAVKILGSLLGNNAVSSGLGKEVLGGLLGSVLGGGSGGSSGRASSGSSGGLGGLGDMVGSVLGGQSRSQSGGLGGLGELLGGALGGQSSNQASQGGGLGGLLGAAMKTFGENQNLPPEQQHDCSAHLPSGMNQAQANEEATIMIRAMINAAKADGRVDQQEQENILKRLGNVSQEELAFVRNELSQPLDVDGFIRSIPRHMGPQVYALSLMTVDLDTNPEAQYLHQLGQGIGLTPEMSNQIHQQVGAPPLYS